MVVPRARLGKDPSLPLGVFKEGGQGGAMPVASEDESAASSSVGAAEGSADLDGSVADISQKSKFL